MAHLVSYFILSIILGISSLLNAENFEATKQAQPAYYAPDQTSARDYNARDQTSRDYNGQDQASSRDYKARDQSSARDYNTRDGSEENALPAYYRNNFDCSAHRYSFGMYADLDFQCQVYHVCHNNRKETFLCPKGTLFNQQILSCDHWYSVRCQDTPNFYSVNELLGKSSNRTHGGAGGPYSTRRFPGSSYGQQGYGSSHLQNQLNPISERDQTNGTRYGSNQVQRGGEYDGNNPSNGYSTHSQFGRPGQYGDSQIGSSGLSGSQDSSWNRQTESSFDRQLNPTGSQSSLYDRRQPQPGYPGSSSFDTQKPLSGIKGPLSDRTRTQPGSSRPGYPYRNQFSSTGSQRSSFSRPQSGVDRFSSGRQPSLTGSRGSDFDKPELRPGSFESSVDEKQPDSGRYPYGRQPFGGGSTRQPFDRPESGSFDRPESGVNRYPYGRQPSSQTTSGTAYDRQSGVDRYPTGRHIPGQRESGFDRPNVRPDFPSSSSDRTQPGSGRYPYGRQPFETGTQPDRTRPGSDRYSFGRDPSEIGKPYGRPGSQPSPFDNRLTGRGFAYTTQRPPIGSEGYDVQKPLGGPRGPGSLNYNTPTTGFQNTRFTQPPRGYTGSQYNNLQSSNYGRGSGSGFQPQSHTLSRPENRRPQSWRYNQYSSQTSSEWSTDSPLGNVPRNGLQTPYTPPGRLLNKNGTSVFGSHQKSTDVNSHVKDRNMLGQSSQQGESSVPSSDQEGLKPILVYQKHVPVPIAKNTTEDGSDSKETVTNEEVPAYKLYYVKEDQIKN